MLSSFRKLVVYQRAMDALVRVNQLCLRLPREFLFVAWQARRAASSVILNTTEGAAEDRPLEKARMYRLARRSAWETQAALEIGVRLDVFDPHDVSVADEELDRVSAMLWTLTSRAQIRAAQQRRSNRKR